MLALPNRGLEKWSKVVVPPSANTLELGEWFNFNDSTVRKAPAMHGWACPEGWNGETRSAGNGTHLCKQVNRIQPPYLVPRPSLQCGQATQKDLDAKVPSERSWVSGDKVLRQHLCNYFGKMIMTHLLALLCSRKMFLFGLHASNFNCYSN